LNNLLLINEITKNIFGNSLLQYLKVAIKKVQDKNFLQRLTKLKELFKTKQDAH